MADNDDRMDRFDGRLDGLAEDLGVLKDDVRVLKDDVGALKGDVHRLRVLHEEHDTKISAIAEIQARHGNHLEEHGRLLQEIKRELAPLGDIRDFVRRIADDHEQRLSALEKHTGIQ